MAIAEDLDLGATDEVDAAFGLIVDVLRLMPTEEGIVRCGAYQSGLLGLEAELLARRKAAGASDRSNEDIVGRSRKTTKQEAKRRAKRGKVVSLNPDLAEDMADGSLGPEQVDAIATATDATDGAAATSEELIGEIKAGNPDDAKTIATTWTEDHQTKGQREDRRQRQRRRRKVSRFPTKNGLEGILIEGDREAIDEMWKPIRALAKKLYVKDGGRDVTVANHPRTRDQRMFDAAHQLLGAKAATKTSSKTASAPGVQVFLWTKLDDVVAGSPIVRFGDGRIVPDTVLSRYMCDASIAGVVFDQNGELLWQGRSVRYATPAQIRGLIARDKGCVICHADVSECVAHHLIPWNAPLKGETNIEELALVCDDCHHHIHDNTLTLYRDESGRWQLRPAKPEETPPNCNGP
jgi:hypothetical protein